MPGLQIGIDLGTTSILVYVRGKGVVLHEASVAALDAKTGDVLALGNRVYQMVGRNPDSLRVVHPMRDGVISDFSVIHAMIAYYIKRICGNRMFKPSVMICMPASVTGLERSAILELAIAAGAGRACLVEEPLAAALGAGMNIAYRGGQMIVDIGGGTTDVAVLTMGTMALSRSAKVAGNALSAAIQRYLRRERNVMVGDLTAEEIKRKVGCARLRSTELAIYTRGQSYITRLPTRLEVSSTESFLAMRERLDDIIDVIHRVLEETPPEMAGDIADQGVVLTGGGALLRDLDALLQERTQLRVRVAKDPVNCVALGLGVMMESQNILEENSYFYRTDDDIGEYARNRNL
ncbi:MAG: rod shape-determining protein [Oscillospiraceae bacterium]|jgi:rod shape-determining protein MreB|nr:rod shape-determining protein [Oscillospiraceae bacterium]